MNTMIICDEDLAGQIYMGKEELNVRSIGLCHVRRRTEADVILSMSVRLKANEAAILTLRMKNYNKHSDNKQVCSPKSE